MKMKMKPQKNAKKSGGLSEDEAVREQKVEETGSERAFEDGDERNGDYVVKSSRGFDWGARIGALLLAFLLWMYAMNTESPTHETAIGSIPVKIENLASTGLSLIGGSGVTVDLSVVGKRSDVSQLSADDFQAFVDVGSVSDAGKYTFDVQIVSPSGVTITQKTPSAVTLYLDNTASVSIPVTANLQNYQLESGYELGDIQLSPSEITVTGPADALDDIEFAQATWDLGYITSSMKISCGVELIDGSGAVVKSPYISLQTSDVTVTVPVYRTKEVPLRAVYKNGYFNDSNVRVSLSPEKVTVRGEPSAVDAIDAIDVMVDEKKAIASSVTQNLVLPEGIETTDGVSSVTMSIKHVGTSTMQLSVPLNVIKSAGTVYSLPSETVNITFRGPSELLAEMTAEDVRAVVDLMHVGSAQGSMSLPVRIVVGGRFSGEVYELDEYSATVVIG